MEDVLRAGRAVHCFLSAAAPGRLLLSSHSGNAPVDIDYLSALHGNVQSRTHQDRLAAYIGIVDGAEIPLLPASCSWWL